MANQEDRGDDDDCEQGIAALPPLPPGSLVTLTAEEWLELLRILENPPKLPQWVLDAIHEKREPTAGDLRKLGFVIHKEIPDTALVVVEKSTIWSIMDGCWNVNFHMQFRW